MVTPNEATASCPPKDSIPTLPMSVETIPVSFNVYGSDQDQRVSQQLPTEGRKELVERLTRMNHDHSDLVLFRVFLVNMNPYKVDGRLGRSVGGQGERYRSGQRPSKGAGDDKLLLRLGRFEEERIEGLEQVKRSEGVGLPMSLHVPVVDLEDGFGGFGDT